MTDYMRASGEGDPNYQLTLKLDESATPIPADTSIRIRPRSAFLTSHR